MRGLADRQAIEQLATLLDAAELRSGQDEADERLDAQLASLLVGVHALRQLPLATTMDAEAHARARRRLVAVAAVQPPNGTQTTIERSPEAAGTPLWRRRGVVVGTAGAAAVLAVAAVGVVSVVSQSGSPVDSVKRDAQRARVAATSEADQGRVLLSLAGTGLSKATKSDNPVEQAATLRSMTMQWTRGFRLLSTAAVAEHSQAPLNTAAGYLKQQRPPVATLVNTAPGGSAHIAAVATLRLLDQVHVRVGELRSTLDCASVARADALGPLPGTCTPGRSSGTTPSGGTAPRGGGLTPTAQPSPPAQPTYAPSAQASASPTAGIGGSVPPSTGGSPSPSPSTEPTSSSPSPSPSPSSSPSPSPESPSPSQSDVSPSASPASDGAAIPDGSTGQTEPAPSTTPDSSAS